jgi:hypothetical protein
MPSDKAPMPSNKAPIPVGESYEGYVQDNMMGDMTGNMEAAPKSDRWARAWEEQDYKTLADIMAGADAYDPVADMSQRVAGRVLASRKRQPPMDDGASLKELEKASGAGMFVPGRNGSQGTMSQPNKAPMVPAPMVAALGSEAGPAAEMMELSAGSRPDGDIIRQSRMLGRPVTRADLDEGLVQALDQDPEMESWLVQSGFMSAQRKPKRATSPDMSMDSMDSMAAARR